MKTKLLALSIVLILLVLLAVNLYWYNKNKIPKGVIIDSKTDYNINLSEFRKINTNIQETDGNTVDLTYIYNIAECPGCIYNMYESIKKYSSLSNSIINVIIVWDNFKETQEYCENYLKEYYEYVHFYYSNHEQFKELNIKFTPFLIVEENGEFVFGFIFREELEPLWDISSKYLNSFEISS